MSTLTLCLTRVNVPKARFYVLATDTDTSGTQTRIPSIEQPPTEVNGAAQEGWRSTSQHHQTPTVTSVALQRDASALFDAFTQCRAAEPDHLSCRDDAG